MKKYRGGQIAKACLFCGKVMQVWPYAKDMKRFCSRKCRAKWNYRHGVISEEFNRKGKKGYESANAIWERNHPGIKAPWGFKKGDVPKTKGTGWQGNLSHSPQEEEKMSHKCRDTAYFLLLVAIFHVYPDDSTINKIFNVGVYILAMILWTVHVFTDDD